MAQTHKITVALLVLSNAKNSYDPIGNLILLIIALVMIIVIDDQYANDDDIILLIIITLIIIMFTTIICTANNYNCNFKVNRSTSDKCDAQVRV